MKNLLLFAFILITALSSCSKDNDEKTCETTTTSLAGTYKMTSLKYQPAPGAQQDDWFTSVVESCKRDDLYILTSAGGFSIQDAGTVCSPDGNYENGAWTLVGNEINMDGFYSGTIESFNCSTLVFYDTEVLVSGDKLTATFVKQ